MEIESFLIFYQAVYAGTCAKSLERCISFAKHMSGHACAYKDNYSGRSFFCSCVHLPIIQLQS